jgi:ABC-type multidrug transport system ATPase subunit/pSer/pThr/pTyr-binding forkhead associated (FHA) protein
MLAANPSSMIPGFGKQAILIGSAADCDIVLPVPGVAPHHARIVHQGNGQLAFVDNAQGPSAGGGRPIAPGQTVPFDLQTPFSVGQAQVPLSHPAIGLMLMARGQFQAPPGQLLVGHDPQRCNLVIQHPAIAPLHALLACDRLTLTDLGSPAGVSIGQARIAPQNPVQVDPRMVVLLGPLALPVGMLLQVAKSFGITVAEPPPAQMQPQGATPAPKKHQTMIGQLDFSQGSSQNRSIGRTPDNDIVVNHPQVSSKHAVLVRVGNELFIEDRGSANGTYVRGQRVPPGQRVPVQNGEKIYVGPMPLLIRISKEATGAHEVFIEDQGQWAGRPLYEIEAWDLFLEVPDRDNTAQKKVLLDHVSFKALPGDMIALMGPSGAGKTTLLLALNGYLPPTSGQVRVNGEDLYLIYDNLRGSIGYVPQDDIVHPELTVFEAVRYSAKFRLPPDYSDEEIDRRVDMTLSQLGLEMVRNLQIGKPEKKILSGGQRKRVNIAMELVTDPVILFLDEPTSGLAADDTTALITLLHDFAKKTGKTIIMTIHQPAKDEFEKFNVALVMGYGGTPMFFGPTKPDAYRFFGSWNERQGKGAIDNPRDMFDMLNLRERPIFEHLRAQDPNAGRGQARQLAAKEWNREFFNNANPTFQKMYSNKRAVGTEPTTRGIPHRGATTSGQLRLLLSRYFKVKMRDVGGTAIMLLQAPIIGAMLAGVFGGQRASIPYWCLGALQELMHKGGQASQSQTNFLGTMKSTDDHTGAIFFLVVAAVWFGTSNAAREIVSERAIYLRERMVNLGLFNYVFSKFLLLSFFCIIQCTLLLGIVFFALGFNGGPQAFLLELAVMITTSICAVAVGLLLSTVVASSEAAMALTPIALIPQVVLGGLMVPMTTNPMLKYFMMVMPARWGFQGVVAQERMAIAADPAWVIDLQNPTLTVADDFIKNGHFKCATAQIASDTFNGAWGFANFEYTWIPPAILGGMTAFMLIFMLAVLKRRDPV